MAGGEGSGIRMLAPAGCKKRFLEVDGDRQSGGLA